MITQYCQTHIEAAKENAAQGDSVEDVHAELVARYGWKCQADAECDAEVKWLVRSFAPDAGGDEPKAASAASAVPEAPPSQVDEALKAFAAQLEAQAANAQPVTDSGVGGS